MKTITKRPVKLLLTTAILLTPAVFGNSQAVFRADDQLSACSSGLSASESVYSLPTSTSSAVSGWGEAPSALFSGSSFGSVEEDREESADGEQPSSTTVADVAAVVPAAVVDAVSKKEESAFQELVAKHAGTAAYKAIYPELRKILMFQLQKKLYGTGTFAMTADGQQLPVLQDSFEGLFDVVLRAFGVSTTFRKGVDLATTITGNKNLIDAELKILLGFDSFENFVERLTQKAVLRSFGLLNAAPSLSLSEIENVQQSVSLKDGRAQVLSEKAADADLMFATRYVWYELRNIINNVVASSIDAHLAEIKKKAVEKSKEKLDSVVMNAAMWWMTFNGLPGVIPAAALVAVNHTYGAAVIEAGYDVFNQHGVNGMLGVRNTAILPITKAEIEQYHAVATTVEVDNVDEIDDEDDDFISIKGVKESSFGTSFLFSATNNTVRVVASKTAKVVASGVATIATAARKIGSWFGY